MDKPQKFVWGLIAVEDDPIAKLSGYMKVYHFCGYFEKPKDVKKVKENLLKELGTDKQFKLVKKILKNIKIRVAPRKLVAEMSRRLLTEIKKT